MNKNYKMQKHQQKQKMRKYIKKIKKTKFINICIHIYLLLINV